MGITLQNITKTYDKAKQPVLNDVNAEIQDGELFVIVGPSGCGKSTLLRMIAGIIPITSGKLAINGQIMNAVPPKDRKLSMVFQSYALYPFLDVAANVAFGLQARKMPAAEVERRINAALKMVNLTAYRDRKPRELSGGQRQRVALARAIASDAKVCLMDEPLSNLDAQLRVRMRTEIRELQRKLGLTLIYVTHDQTEAMTMADHVMVLNERHVQQIDTPLDIYNHPANHFVAEFFGTPQINLLPVVTKTARNLHVAEGFQIALNQPLNAGSYTIGIRPNQLNAVPVTDERGNGKVTNVETLGEMTIIEVQADKRNDKYYAWLFLGPSILALSVFVFYPMLRTLYLSFFLTNSLGEPTVFVGLQNYLNLLTTKSYLASLQATGIYVVGVTVFTLIGGLLLAAAANQRVRGIELFRTMFTSTMGVSVSVSAIFWLFMFNPSVGLLNKVAIWMHLPAINWLTEPHWAMVAIIMTSVWMHLGFTFLIFFGALQVVPKTLYDAADVAGTSRRYQFIHITLPMISPTLFFAAVITLISAFKSFGLIDLMTAGGPTNATNLLVYRIYRDAFVDGNYALASTESIILAIIIAAITVIQFKLLAKRVHY